MWTGLHWVSRKTAPDQERQAAKAAADAIRREEADLAACSAVDLWRRASLGGTSPYLDRKGVIGEACRYLRDGSLLVPLLRYDMPRDQALRAVQRILPDGSKRFTMGFAKPGCCVRLGSIEPDDLVLVCEGYATGLTLAWPRGTSCPCLWPWMQAICNTLCRCCVSCTPSIAC